MSRLLVSIMIFFSGIAILACTSQPSEKATSTQVENQKMVSEVLSLVEYSKKISEGKVQLVDVRTPEEVAEGKIMNAVNVDYNGDDFKSKIASFKKDEPIYIYCRSGNRSGKSAVIMQELGFQEIYDLKGGYDAWSEARE